ncbi:Ig-like domain-containing protein, partial [Cohnella sp. WQ 127256]|uniref:Ig-like domain-containing protein n=1 Tax=Cohnella sp. WQ 127256 TaxID=2938790 RepID=UPI002119884B
FTPTAGINDTTNVITLNNGGVADLAGNAGTGTTSSNNYTINTVVPTATIVVSDNMLIIGETSLVTITFSEAVTGFTNADLTIANGTLSAVSSSDGGITWTATFTPSNNINDATNVITLDNTGVQNAVGNSGTGSTDSNNYAIDTSRPTATLVVADTSLTIGETSLVTITFTEAVTGFTNADLLIDNGTLSAVSSSDGGITWTATLTPIASVTAATNFIRLDNTGVSDLAGNAGTGSTDSNNYAIDMVRPTAAIVFADTSLLAGETSLVTITFSEAVTGFTNADLTISNGTLSAVSSSDGGITWTATFTPTAGINDLSNVITLDNTGVSDLAGNAGAGSTNSNNYAIDTVRPTATLVIANAALIAGETSLVTISFSEAVSGFTNADLMIANGTLSAVSSSDGGITWTATFTPTDSLIAGSNLITLDNTGVQNAAGNTGAGTTDSNNYAIDTSRPTATIVVADTSLTIGETSLVTITFTEAVIGFTNDDLTIANGTLSAVSSSDGGITWTATFTPQANVSVAANLITLQNSGVHNSTGNAGQGTTESNSYSVFTVPVSTDLSSLTLSNGTLSPIFASGTVDYTSSVPNSVSELTVTASVSDNRATMMVNDIPVISGQSSSNIVLTVGSNKITVLVTGQNGTTKTYTLTVTRATSQSSSTDVGGGSSTPIPIPVPIPTDGKLTLPTGQSSQVSLGDAVTISIPKDATKEELKLTISKVLDTQNLVTNVQVLASPIYEMLKNFTENFSKPITLTFVFDPASVKKDQIPVVFYYDEVKKVWVEVKGGKINLNQISVEVDHFTKYAVFAVDQIAVVPGPEQPKDTTTEVKFSDISKHWAEISINQAVYGGIVKGYADGTFKPNATVTRAEFAVMLMNALKPQGNGAELTFSDNAKIGAWAQKAVAQALQAGIIKGNQDGSFRPNAEVTRAEMAVMIANALGQPIEANATTSFADDKDIPAWAKGSIAIVKQAGIVQGNSDNNFSPQDNATRAEAVTVLLKMLAHKN